MGIGVERDDQVASNDPDNGEKVSAEGRVRKTGGSTVPRKMFTSEYLKMLRTRVFILCEE